MHLQLWNLIALVLMTLIKSSANAQTLEVSPCPRLFTYEGKSPYPDRWYGIITLLSDSNLTGVWIRIIFDKPIIQLGNWFGEVVKRGEMDYLIRDPKFNLKAHTTKIVRIFVKYNTNKPPPELIQFRINGKTVCPEDLETTTPSTTTEQLFTSAEEHHAVAATEAAISLATTAGYAVSGNEEHTITGSHKNEQLHIANANLDSICGTTVEYRRQERHSEQVAHKGQFPWHAALYYTKGVTIAYLCGASLISKNHLITVAHCVIRQKSQSPINAELVIVYLGKYYVKHWANEPTQTLYVSQIISHPGFNSETYNNDVALLKLQYPAEISNVVRPVCLWKESTDFSYVANKPGTVVGWGFDETGKIEDALMCVQMIIQGAEVCSASIANYDAKFQSNNNIYCANFVNNTMECVGDSGGGMVFPSFASNNSKPVWYLRGLVTYSVVLQHQLKCDSDHCVVFTDVAKYLDWIKESMLL